MALTRNQHDDWTFNFLIKVNGVALPLTDFVFEFAIFDKDNNEVINITQSSGDIVVDEPNGLVEVSVPRVMTVIDPDKYKIWLQSLDADSKRKTWTPRGLALNVVEGKDLIS